MKSFDAIILEEITRRLEILEDHCENCPQMVICEDQGHLGESRYCLPLIEAAIIGKSTFKTLHKKIKP